MYGTREDPEYIVNVFRPGSIASLLSYAGLILLFPLLVFLRFLLAPLTFLHSRPRLDADARFFADDEFPLSPPADGIRPLGSDRGGIIVLRGRP